MSSTKPKIYFLGDSFTAGAGVDFRETYYFKTGLSLESDYNFFNISRPGLSTRGEHSELLNFNKTINSNPDIVVHQYFINDIDDYIAKPAWEIPVWLELLSRHLESAQLLGIYLFNQEWSNAYRDSLLNAYQSPELLERHENDVKLLHQGIRDNGGTVVFLAFPSLRDMDIGATSLVIDKARRFFSRTCQPADMFIDATPAALSLGESERVVSFLDQHPSPALHSLIANQVVMAIRRESAQGARYNAYETCESLKATQARDAEAPP
ncbi:MAG: hypothetical protein K0Q68_1449 [Moraxellaceae bacterium]|nr:hypothetical protein [Moraxellaceae bacterium]